MLETEGLELRMLRRMELFTGRKHLQMEREWDSTVILTRLVKLSLSDTALVRMDSRF